MNTFISDAPWPSDPLRFERKFTDPANGFSAKGKNTGPRFCCAAARAVGQFTKRLRGSPEDR